MYKSVRMQLMNLIFTSILLTIVVTLRVILRNFLTQNICIETTAQRRDVREWNNSQSYDICTRVLLVRAAN